MHVRCPHCHNPIEIVDDVELSDVECPSCGSGFSLVGDGKETESYEREEKTIGHFTLVRQLGVGAFGAVWQAKDMELDRKVAIKIPRKGHLTPGETEQFLREARSAAQLKHPNIVPVHEVGREDGQVYIVSDLIDGVTLADRLEAGPLSAEECADLVSKIAEAVHHAHKMGIIHRDLKPSNILIDANGQPHVTDFGLAKREAGEITMTIDGAILGTPAYMPPEQACGEGHRADARSDVYSLGVILFECLTGELPFRGNRRMLLHQVLNEDAPSPRRFDAAVPKDLATIAMRCLEKIANLRFQNAKQLSEDLGRYLAGKPVKSRPITFMERGLRWCRRKPLVAGLIGLSSVAVVSGAAASLFFGIQALGEAQRADENATRADAKATEAKRLADNATKAMHRANSLRLVSESRGARTDYPVRSLLYAIEAVEAPRKQGLEVPPVAHENLLVSVAKVGGSPVAESLFIVREGAKRFVTTRYGDESLDVWRITSDGIEAKTKVRLDKELSSIWLDDEARWCVVRTLGESWHALDLSAVTPKTVRLVGAKHLSNPELSAIGGYFVASTDEGIRLWRLSNGATPEINPIVIDDGQRKTSRLDLSPNARWLMRTWTTGKAPESLQTGFDLWDLTQVDGDSLADGIETKLQGAHWPFASPQETPFSRKGRWLITSRKQGDRQLWDLDTPLPKPVNLAGTSRCMCQFGPNDRWLLATRTGKKSITTVWDLRKDSIVSRGLGGFGAPVASDLFAHPRISPQGKWLITAGARGNWRLWDLKSELFQRPVSTIADPKRTSKTRLLFSPDERWLIASEKSIRLWNLQNVSQSSSKAPSAVELTGHDGSNVFCRFSSDSRWLISGDGKQTRAWSLHSVVESASPLRLNVADPEMVNLVSFSPDGRWLAATTQGSEVGTRIWGMGESGVQGRSTDFPAIGPSLFQHRFSQDSRWVVTPSPNGLWINKLPNNKSMEVEPPKFLSAKRYSGRPYFSSDGNWLFWEVSKWNLSDPDISGSKEPAARIAPEHSIRAWRRDGKVLATSNGEVIKIWSVSAEGASLKNSLRREGHVVTALVLGPQGNTVISLSNTPGGIALAWDIESASVIELTSASETYNKNATFSDDGRWLAVAAHRIAKDGFRPSVFLWDLLSEADPSTNTKQRGWVDDRPRTVTEITNIDSSGLGVVFAPSGKWMATFGTNVQLFDLHTDNLQDSRRTLPIERPSSIAFSPDGRWLATGCATEIRLWDLDLDSLLERAYRQAGRELSAEERLPGIQ